MMIFTNPLFQVLLYLLLQIGLSSAPPPNAETHVLIPHDRLPAVPVRNAYKDAEIEELVTRPYFPVRPADYQGMRYVLNFSASYRAYAYHNGVYLGYSNDAAAHETVSGHAGYGDVFSLVARARAGKTGVIASLAVGRYFVATGMEESGIGFKVATAAQMETEGRNWKFRSMGNCLWTEEAVALEVNGSDASHVVRSKTFPYGRTQARYVWGPGRGGETEGVIWLRYAVGGLPCARPSARPSARAMGTNTCFCREVQGNVHGECYEFKDGGSGAAGGWRVGEKRWCESRECGPSYECVDTESKLMCVRRTVEVEIRKATAIFNGKCMEVRVGGKEVYMPYH